MSLSRRQFIQASGIALCAGAMPLTASAAGQQQPLPIPPIESRRGQPLFLTLQRSHWSFTQGTRAPVWGINGRYLGPTIRVWNGDDVKLIYSNRLKMSP
jgi:suppressor of ftsI